MPGMPGVDIDRVHHRRPVPLHLPAVLCPAGAECAPQQAAGSGDAGRDSPPPRRTWPGRDLGVREPYPGEVGLSWAEVHCGLASGVLA